MLLPGIRIPVPPRRHSGSPVVPSDTQVAVYASMAVAHRHLYKSAQHCAAGAACVLLPGIRIPVPPRHHSGSPVVPSDAQMAVYASMAVAHRHLYKSAQHCAAGAACVLLSGIRIPVPPRRHYMLIPVVPSDDRIAAHASMAAILSPSGDLYSTSIPVDATGWGELIFVV